MSGDEYVNTDFLLHCQYGDFMHIQGHDASDEAIAEYKEILNEQIRFTIPAKFQNIRDSVKWYISPKAYDLDGQPVTRVMWKTELMYKV